jgi:protein-S-isoprenylcysteine O-methyltransferase Ste14
MSTNKFFVPESRIQYDRAHHVVADGPYRWVRHPGNAGSILMYLATGLVLGSGLGFLVGLIGAGRMTQIVSREDRLLLGRRPDCPKGKLDGLPGYRDYAEKVRWRLWPRLY